MEVEEVSRSFIQLNQYNNVNVIHCHVKATSLIFNNAFEIKFNEMEIPKYKFL